MTEKYKDRPIVLIDLDNTILNFDIAERNALTTAFLEYGIEPTEELLRRYSVINKRYWEMLERGEMSREKLLVGRFQELFDEIGCKVPAAEVQDRYEEVLSTGHWFMPGAEDMLEALCGKCRLFICSNGNAQVQDGRLASSGIEKYFEGIFISERIGYDKPDARYFDACFARIPDFTKERAIMIGDSLTSDIRGGVNAGIKTCWFNPKNEENRSGLKPDYEIRRLQQIPELVERVSC